MDVDKMFESKSNTEYDMFMSYLRKAGVWKAINRSIRMLYKVFMQSKPPNSPIEFVRKNLSRTNIDKEKIKEVLKEMSNCKQILMILSRDKCMLSKNLITVCRRLQKNSPKRFDHMKDFLKFKIVEELDYDKITLHSDYSHADHVEEEYVD